MSEFFIYSKEGREIYILQGTAPSVVNYILNILSSSKHGISSIWSSNKENKCYISPFNQDVAAIPGIPTKTEVKGLWAVFFHCVCTDSEGDGIPS